MNLGHTETFLYVSNKFYSKKTQIISMQKDYNSSPHQVTPEKL